MFKKKSNLLGATLLELVIAMTLGVLIVSILFKIYLASRKSFELQQTLKRNQTCATIAIDRLTKAVRSAGYVGCRYLNSSDPGQSYLSYSLTPQNKLIGTDSSITARYVEFPGLTLVQPMQEDNVLYTDKAILFSKNQLMLVSDCQHFEIFRASIVSAATHTQRITTSYPLRHRYGAYAEIGRLRINTYFIAKTKQSYPDGTPMYALFFQGIPGQKIKLVKNISSMKITYYIYANGAVSEKAPENITDWAAVVGVRVDLIVKTPPFIKHWSTYIAVGPSNEH